MVVKLLFINNSRQISNLKKLRNNENYVFYIADLPKEKLMTQLNHLAISRFRFMEPYIF